MSQVGSSRFTHCHRKMGYPSLEECRQKPANFIRFFPTCLPILGKEITSLYVCPVEDPRSSPSPEKTSLGWTPCYLLLPTTVGKVRDLRIRKLFLTKQAFQSYRGPSGFNVPQAHRPLWGMTKDYKINKGYRRSKSVL